MLISTLLDALGRPTSSQQTTGGQTFTFPNYTFNLADKLTSVTYPISGRIVSTSYDLAGRPVGVSGSQNSVPTTYATVPLPPLSGYASHGALQQMTLGNSLVEQSCFNNRLQPVAIRLGVGVTTNCGNSGADPLNLGYGYTSGNNNENIATQTITRWTGSTWSATLNYSVYDGLNRLTNTSESSGWAETDSYDEFGNRWANITGLTTTLETPIAQSWYTANNQITGWGYDGSGNVTSILGMSRSFSYDGENRQTLATINSQPTTYVYDGDGRRVQKIAPSGTTTYVYDAQGQLAQESGPAATGTSYLTPDALGSTRLVTDSSGAQLKCYDYTPFGTEIPSGVDNRPSCYGSVVYPSSPDVVTEKFTSKERDAESGLDFFGARYMSSAQGRFTSPDPSNLSVDFWQPQTWNRYSYGVNNPLSIVDRNGLWPTWVHNQIINEAFPGLSADQLKNLQTASKNVDRDQSLAGAYKHGLANGQDPNGAVHGEMDSDDFIRKNQHDAQSIQADWIASGHTGIAPGGLTAFGNALHTITDKTSPSHEYFLPWYGLGLFDLPEAGYHFVLEAWPWGGNQQRQQNAVNAARAAYLWVFEAMRLRKLKHRRKRKTYRPRFVIKPTMVRSVNRRCGAHPPRRSSSCEKSLDLSSDRISDRSLRGATVLSPGFYCRRRLRRAHQSAGRNVYGWTSRGRSARW
jgi:RHS repeat-associated protein